MGIATLPEYNELLEWSRDFLSNIDHKVTCQKGSYNLKC